VAAATAAIDGSDMINHPNVVEHFKDEDSTWTAGFNDFFGNMTFDEAKSLLGTVETDLDSVTWADELLGFADSDIPDSFDATDGKSFPAGSIAPIRDQQHCGSCWAFSAVEVLTDRYRIATKNVNSPVLSPEDLVTCDTKDAGCQGGQLPAAWNFLTNTGVVSDDCLPYKSGTGTASECSTTCKGSGEYKKYKATGAKAIRGVANMQKEIMTNGPIQVAFKVYKSFMTYKSGVYKKKFYEFLPEGGHAVKIVGWGTESGTDYWLVANSWNTSWGLKGFFKIARGGDQCGIETMGPPYAGMPAV